MTTFDHLFDFEWGVLEECAGLRPASSYDFFVADVLAFLRSEGLIDNTGKPTTKGLEALAARKPT